MGPPSLGQMLGGLGSLLGSSQQQQNNLQWQLANTSNAGTWNSSYVVTCEPVEPVRASAPHVESAVEWLDRRVNEVRLKLAA